MMIRILGGTLALALSFVSLALLLSPIVPSFEAADLASSQHVFFVGLGALSLYLAIRLWTWVCLPAGMKSSRS